MFFLEVGLGVEGEGVKWQGDEVAQTLYIHMYKCINN
jgi:hypothetical protein